MRTRPTPAELKYMIWEIDDDLDGMISEFEFMTMYKWVKDDETGLEPWKFFNLAQFLMYDVEQSGYVIPEQTLQILYVWHGREGLDGEIKQIFGDD